MNKQNLFLTVSGINKLVLSVVLTLSLLYVIPSISAEKTNDKAITVEGYADLKPNGSRVDARQSAIADALRSAVRQAVGVLIDNQSYTVDKETIEDSIITKAKGYVKQYKILYETEFKGSYTVGIKALVSLDDIKNDIDYLKMKIKRSGNPRIMVVIPETLLFRPKVPDPAGETEVIRQLTDAGYTVVEQSYIKEVRYGEEVSKILEGDYNVARIISRPYADILVIGEAVAELVGNIGGGLISSRARIEIKIIDVDTGDIITSYAIHEAGIDITDALAAKKALENAGNKIALYVKDKLSSFVNRGEKNISISITNVLNSKTLNGIEKTLKGLHGINGVYLRNYNQTTKTAYLDLDCELNTSLLAAKIENAGALNLVATSILFSKIEFRYNR